MERRNRFLIGFAAAVITFGSLMAFVGRGHFHHQGRFYRDSYECGPGGHGFRDGDCYKHPKNDREQAPETPQNSGNDQKQ